MLLQLVNLRLSQHAPVSHPYHSLQPKPLPQLLHLVGYRRRLARMARINLHPHRPPPHPSSPRRRCWAVLSLRRGCNHTAPRGTCVLHKNCSSRRKAPGRLLSDGAQPASSRSAPSAPATSPSLGTDRSPWPLPLPIPRLRWWCATRASPPISTPGAINRWTIRTTTKSCSQRRWPAIRESKLSLRIIARRAST